MDITSKIYLGLPTSPVELLTNGDFELQTGDDFDDWTETIPAYAELTLNPGFETAGGGGADVFGSWTESTVGTGTVVDEGAEVHGGSHSAKLTGDGTNSNYGRVRQVITVVAGKTYRLSLWVKGPYSFGYWFDDVNGAIVNGNNANWGQVTVDYVAPGTKFEWFLVSNTNGTSGTAYYDDVKIGVVTGDIELTATSHGGSDAVKITGAGGTNTQPYLHQSVVSDPGDPHRLSFWSKGDGSNGVAYEIYDVTNGAVIASGYGTTDTTYTETVETYYVPASCVSIKITFTGNGSAVVYLDDVSLLEYGSLNWFENEDVLATPAPTWGYGLEGKDPLRGVAGTGIANFTLKNREGKYSPENVARITGFEEGMPVKITTAVDIEVEIADDLLLNGGFET